MKIQSTKIRVGSPILYIIHKPCFVQLKNLSKRLVDVTNDQNADSNRTTNDSF